MSVICIVLAEKVSHNYHRNGGLAVVAADEGAALILLGEQDGVEVTDEEWSLRVTYPLQGDMHPARVFVFPDAGCC